MCLSEHSNNEIKFIQCRIVIIILCVYSFSAIMRRQEESEMIFLVRNEKKFNDYDKITKKKKERKKSHKKFPLTHSVYIIHKNNLVHIFHRHIEL